MTLATSLRTCKAGLVLMLREPVELVPLQPTSQVEGTHVCDRNYNGYTCSLIQPR